MSFKNLEGETGPAGPVRPATDAGGPPVTAPATADPAAAEPGTLENPLQITDPRAMRALAHPARIAILQHLVIDGPATATECAEVAGLSPSACSYHLRALARHGFVAEDPGSAVDGRHRPWRALAVSMTFGQDPSQPDAVRAASRLLTESLRARVEDVRADYFDRQAEYPPEWRDAAANQLDVLHVTAAELVSCQAELQAVLARYRRLDRADRPTGARRVHAIIDLVPWFDPGGDR